MDKLGERLIRDRDEAAKKRRHASELDILAQQLRREADELDRVAELSRLELPQRMPGADPKTGKYSTAQMLHDEFFGGDTSQPLFD